MKITPHEITIRELTDEYRNSKYSGVRGYHDMLNIRPAYQREMIYSRDKQVDVIESILEGFPIGIMYWAKNKSENPEVDFEYEVIDGQQRTISICEYVVLDHYQVRGQLFSALDDVTKNKILDYKILVYFCEGDPEETLKWFERINIAGEPLTEQELRNASYTGVWLSNAKSYFKAGGPASDLFSNYFKGLPNKGEWNRWAGLELALDWAVQEDEDCKTIEEYMAAHRNDKDAEELWERFEDTFLWIEEAFPPEKNRDVKKRSDLMKKVNHKWRGLYLQYKDEEFDADEIEKQLVKLFADDEIDPKHKEKIFVYVITGNEHDLQLRYFPDELKAQMYAEQKHRCPVCYGLRKLSGDDSLPQDPEYDYKEMEGDHIQPWSKGGKTEYENLAMLCEKHNNVKSDMIWSDIKRFRDELRNLPSNE